MNQRPDNLNMRHGLRPFQLCVTPRLHVLGAEKTSAEDKLLHPRSSLFRRAPSLLEMHLNEFSHSSRWSAKTDLRSTFICKLPKCQWFLKYLLSAVEANCMKSFFFSSLHPCRHLKTWHMLAHLEPLLWEVPRQRAVHYTRPSTVFHVI